jgi:hypothetical protein
MNSNDYFVAVYTNEVKDYAVPKFFKHFDQFTIGGVVDNSTNPNYHEKLKKFTNLPVYHLDIPYEPKKTLFQRNVATSVQFLRELFLKTDCKYFLILESDVIPTPTLLEDIDKSIQKLEEVSKSDPLPWGALGCLYYHGFHDYNKEGLHKTHHVLSGATAYKREAVEKYPFRRSIDDLGAFPDAWWSVDAGKEYSLWNDHDIKLEHLHHTNKTRYSKNL